MILDYKISIGQFILFLYIYIIIRYQIPRLRASNPGGRQVSSSILRLLYALPILIVSFNSAWYLSSLIPLYNNVSYIVYLLVFIGYNIYFIWFVIRASGSEKPQEHQKRQNPSLTSIQRLDKFTINDIINIVFILIIVIMEIILIKYKPYTLISYLILAVCIVLLFSPLSVWLFTLLFHRSYPIATFTDKLFGIIPIIN